MPKGVYERTKENRKKIGEARRRYYDEHGRVVEIDQRIDPRGYNREYQRQWRAMHKHYYRDRRRMKKKLIAGDDMKGLKEIVSKFNEFQVNILEVKYHTRAFNEEKMKTLVDDLNKLMNDYIANLKDNSEGNDESDNQ